MNEPIESIKYKGHTINVLYDFDPQNPRTAWDNLGTMLCNHSRYNLGDQNIKRKVYPTDQKYIWLPLYLYDHSGITIATSSAQFRMVDSMGWDWGHVGWIYVSKKKVREEFGWKRITTARKEKIETYLQNEVKTYDDFLRGVVYGYEIITPGGNDGDSCWGYYGDTDYCLQQAMATVDAAIEYEKKKQLSLELK